MPKKFTPDDCRRLAAKTGANEAYLSQCLRGHRNMKSGKAHQVVAASEGELQLWDVCQKTWFQHWPNLIGKKGAPPVPAKQEA